MDSRRLLFVSLLGTLVIMLWGCDVETEPQGKANYPPAGHVVINEVYTLPASNANAHSWLEIYNPTGQSVDLTRSSVRFTTSRYQLIIAVYYDTVGHRGQILPSDFTTSFTPAGIDTAIDVPIYRLMDSLSVRVFPLIDSPRVVGPPVDFKLRSRSPSFVLGPGEFLTLVSDIDRLRVFNNIGPGPGPEPRSSPTLPLYQDNVSYVAHLDTAIAFAVPSNSYRAVIHERDTTLLGTQRPIADSVYAYYYTFYLRQTDELVLKDSLGSTVDVVRYGGYVYSGPGADPYPNNHSFGVVPEYESIARYAGAYETGNTANDFYHTGPGLRPIPQWISVLSKP